MKSKNVDRDGIHKPQVNTQPGKKAKATNEFDPKVKTHSKPGTFASTGTSKPPASKPNPKAKGKKSGIAREVKTGVSAIANRRQAIKDALK